MNVRRTADLQRCLLAAILLTCLYIGNAVVMLARSVSPAAFILVALGIGAASVAVGLWHLQQWVWHGAHLLGLLGLLLGSIGVIVRFQGGQLDLSSATLIALVSALLIVFVRRRDVRRALGR